MGLASEWIQSVKSSVGGGLESSQEFVRKHPVTSAVTIGGGLLAATQIVKIARKKRKGAAKVKRKTSKARAKKKYGGHTKRGWKLDRAKRSKQPWELAYQRRKKAKSKKKTKKRVGVIYYTKKGQPYKVNSKGQAKFIKKSKGRKR